MPLRLTFGLLALALLFRPTFAAEPVVRVGAGGYLTSPTKHIQQLPETIYKTSGVAGPMVTNQWWSSLVWQKFSQPTFPHPLEVACTPEGLRVNYPGAKIHGNPSGIFGTSAKDGDFKIGHSAVAKKFDQADCDGFSDWFVTAKFASEKGSLRTSFGHGSPYVYCSYESGSPTIAFTAKPKVWSGGADEPVLGVTVNGHHYGLFGATGSRWRGLDSFNFENQTDKSYFAIALLPDDQPETLTLFQQYAYNHMVHTVWEATVKGGIVKTRFRFTIRQHEGKARGTLFALYPHQWKYTNAKLVGKSYGSVRGEMKLVEGDSFTTEVPVQGLLPMLPKEGIADRERMLGYLKEEAAKKTPGWADTYFEGKYLGRLVTLSGIAEVMGEKELQQTFVNELKRRLEAWFTATPGKDQPVFYYNDTWGTLIGSRPSFGSDKPLNDHHFHYGYFIRGAAEIARLDPAWAKEWGPMVDLVIRDIASPDRGDKMFPYLRCFDKYAGHSWASGDANFADGNNQESSSESMNAWYGLALWGEATGDAKLRDLGLALFNTERTAVEQYWFDVDGTNYPKDFPQVALGMVWGGKGAFGTWFSGDIDCIHGINWLPFTPASIYMGRHPDYVKKNFDRIAEKRKEGKNFNNGWGDLVVMFGALQDPAMAAVYIDANPNCKVEDGNTRAFMYHWICTLNNLGLNDTGITADYPFTNVYRKGEKKTYAVYNYGEKPLTVKFSDGKMVTAKNGLTVE